MSDELLWSPALRALLSPRRSFGAREPLPTVTVPSEAAAGIFAARRDAIKRGIADAGALATLQEKAIAYLDGAATFEANVAAAAAKLVHSFLQDRREGSPESPAVMSMSAAIVDQWIAEAGAAGAVRACAATCAVVVRRNPAGQALSLAAVECPGDRAADGEDSTIIESRWLALRTRLATMPDADYVAAREVAAERYAVADDHLAVRLAFAFPDEADWVARVVPRISRTDVAALVALVSSTDDPAVVEEIIRRCAGHSWLFAPVALDLAAALGIAAEPALLGIATVTVRSFASRQESQPAIDALALIRTPNVAAWFATYFNAALVPRRTVTRFFRSAPHLAHAALAPLASGRTPDEVALALLADIARASEARVHEEAGAAELPPVLAHPPWGADAKRAKKPKAARLSLKALSFDETVTIPPGDVPPPVRATNTASPGVRLLDAREPPLWSLAHLSEADARAALLATDPRAWYLGDGSGLLYLQLARFGIDALEPLVIMGRKAPIDASTAFEGVDSPRVAPLMAHLFAKVKRARRGAERWLVAHPRAAAVGLMQDVFGSDNKTRGCAASAFQFLQTRGKEDVALAVAAEYGAECKTAFAALAATGFIESAAPMKAPALPEWLPLASLPRPRLAGTERVLSSSALRALVEMLAFTDVEDPYAGIEQVRAACDKSSLAELAWALFESWTLVGSPADEKWTFFALGHFGNDDQARRVARLVRGWPSEGAFARAVVGLDVLATMKSDVALGLIHGIAEKVKSRPLLKAARDKIESVAESLGFTAEELADRLVPTLGLDEDGSRTLDFGARAFRVGFDEHLKPYVKNEKGEKLADLPKAGASDDAEKAAAATAEWKQIKKTAKTVAVAELARLEKAMVAQRLWDVQTFETYVVRHPLVGHLARRLFFGAHDASGALTAMFRVAEDGTYANANDEELALAGDVAISVLHPLEVIPATLATLGDRLADYEILQPFPQIGRDVPRNATAADLAAFTPVATLELLRLERRGWRKCATGDGGVIDSLEKDSGGLRAILRVEPGIHAGDPKAFPAQQPCAVDFTSATSEQAREPTPIFLAEVIADLRTVGAVA